MIFCGRGETCLNLCIIKRKLNALRIIYKPNFADWPIRFKRQWRRIGIVHNIFITKNKLPRRKQRGIGKVIKYFRPKGRGIKPQEIIKPSLICLSFPRKRESNGGASVAPYSSRKTTIEYRSVLFWISLLNHWSSVMFLPTHLLYLKPYSLTQNLWPGTSWIWILIKEPHSTLQGSPPGSGCGGCLTVKN